MVSVWKASAGGCPERLRSAEVEKTRTQLQAMQAQAQADLERQRQQAIADLRKEVANLAVGAAGKLLGDNPFDGSEDELTGGATAARRCLVKAAVERRGDVKRGAYGVGLHGPF